MAPSTCHLMELTSLLQGWLAKRGPTAEFGWRHRWCVLRGGFVLECFADESCLKKKEEVKLPDTTRIVGIKAKSAPGDAAKHYDRAFAFVIDPCPEAGADRRLHYLDALDANSFSSWMRALQLVNRRSSVLSVETGSSSPATSTKAFRYESFARKSFDFWETPSEASTAMTSVETAPGSPRLSPVPLAIPEQQDAALMTPSLKPAATAELAGRCTSQALEPTQGSPEGICGSSCLGQLVQQIRAEAESSPWCVRPLQKLEEARSSCGDWSEQTLNCANRLAWLLYAKSFVKLAVRLYAEVLSGRRRILGSCHPSTWEACNNLGVTLQAIGRLDESHALLLEALDGCRNYLGPRHPDTLHQLGNLAALEFARGYPEVSEALYRDALEGRRVVLGNEHCGTLQSIDHLAALLRKRKQCPGRLEEAEQLCREALEVRWVRLGDTHPSTLVTLRRLVGLLRLQGRTSEASALACEFRALRSRNVSLRFPPASPCDRGGNRNEIGSSALLSDDDEGVGQR